MDGMSFVEQDHLGGYIPGGDEATFYPNLWKWLVKNKGVKTVLDVGCGDGVALDYFAGLGCTVLGIEGVPQYRKDIATHDYTKGPVTLPYEFDLVWSCEFVEHVEEAYVNNFLDSFAKGKLVLMTHAYPGQDGYHHVNCQPASYWIDKLKNIGYDLNTDLTMFTRDLAAKNKSPWNHYARSGLAFERI